VRILLCAVLLAAVCGAQEDVGGGGGGGRGGGRGGRGGRGGGSGGTREFLGLGANGPAPDEAAAKKGEPLYKQHCAACHGDRARGAQAPNLVRSVVVLHDEKGEEIGPVIKNGRPPGMPAFPSLSADDVHNIGQYLKMQVELAANRGTYGATYGTLRNQTSGDPKKGEAFFAANCKSCHSTTGDLAKVGAKFPQATALQSRWIWPTTPGPQKATVTTASGEKVAGTVRVLNDFDVSLMDTAGNYRYWRRSAVKVEVEDKLGGHRALLPKLSDDDIHNMTAYLVTLK
jgi:cytochrome c oxidase cbb3-type subunit III